MKIKTPPYPNFKITEQAHQRDVVADSVEKSDASGLTNKLILVTEFNGEKRVIRSRGVKHKSNSYVTAFPNPIHLFLSLAIEHFDTSEQIKETNFPKCGKQIGTDIYILDIEENGTHDCYNHYVKYRASSIIMLVAALEAFLNHVIPNDFIYKTIRGDKQKEYNKEEIESTKVWFSDKLINVIPQCLSRPTFWDELNLEKDLILDLYENRKSVIHLKTNAEDDLTRYFDAIDKMLDFDISSSIAATVKFMNAVSDKFVEFETA